MYRLFFVLLLLISRNLFLFKNYLRHHLASPLRGALNKNNFLKNKPKCDSLSRLSGKQSKKEFNVQLLDCFAIINIHQKIKIHLMVHNDVKNENAVGGTPTAARDAEGTIIKIFVRP
jgi:hypothetical protein